MFPRYLLVIHAQMEVYFFYEKLGFIPVSDTFVEAGIQHKVTGAILRTLTLGE